MNPYPFADMLVYVKQISRWDINETFTNVFSCSSRRITLERRLLEKLHLCMIIGAIQLSNQNQPRGQKNSEHFLTTLSLNLHHHMKAIPLSMSSPSQQLSHSPVWQSINKNIWTCWIWCKRKLDPLITDLQGIKKTADWILWIALLSQCGKAAPMASVGIGESRRIILEPRALI